MVEYYVVGKDCPGTYDRRQGGAGYEGSKVGDILCRVGGQLNNLSGEYVSDKGSQCGKEMDLKLIIEDDVKLTFLPPIYKGKDTQVVMAYSDEYSYTVRRDGNGTKVFKVKCIGNTKNDSSTVAKNKTVLKRKNYLRKKGYYKSRTEAEKGEGKITSCSLLRKWDDLKDKIEYPIVASGKIDGIRCTYEMDTPLMSRGRKVIIARHIWLNLGSTHDTDGELYIPNASLERIQSVVTKYEHWDKGELHYFIFDIPVAKPFIERLAILEEYREYYKDKTNIHVVPQKVINNEEEADEFYQYCLDKGYEGAVYRTLGGIYCSGRTPEILKRKPIITAEYPVANVLRDKDGLVYFELKCSAGTFKSVPMWSDKDRAAWGWEAYCSNPVGSGRKTVAEVQYHDKTARGIPKFSNVKVLRTIKIEDGELEY